MSCLDLPAQQSILLYSDNKSVDVLVRLFVSVLGEGEGRSLFLSLPLFFLFNAGEGRSN